MFKSNPTKYNNAYIYIYAAYLIEEVREEEDERDDENS